MSTQSGITASSELKNEFKNLCNSQNRALIVQIAQEQCIPDKIIEGSNDFHSDFNSVQSHLSDNEARYILYRQPENDNFLFISFIPDNAHVRSKMLYASSANAVHRELGGSDFFSSIIFWNSLNEVSSKGWSDHQQHEQAEPPRTEEEESLRHVHDQETSQMLGTTGRKSHYGSSGPSSRASPASSGSGMISLEFDPEIDAELKKMNSNSLVGMGIDVKNETVVIRQPIKSFDNQNEIIGFISVDSPQYTVMRSGEKTLFIYTCPTSSKIKERMVYASNRSAAINRVQQYMMVDEIIEATEPKELPSLIQTESIKVAQNSNKLAFSRPKRPGRK